MNTISKLLVILFVCIIPFATIEAKGKKGKQKAKTQQPAKKKSSAAKKQPAKKAAAKPAAPTKKTTSEVKPAEVNPQPRTTRESRDNEPSDTPVTKVVTVTSSFKPSLRNAAKINFTAASPVIDTSRLALTYRVPSQNLFFSYQPVPIKPLAIAVDSSFTWDNHQYIKLGYGNFSTPYAELGLTFGDGKKNITSIYAKHTSSKGNLPAQQFSKTSIEGMTIYNSRNNNEWTAKVNYDRDGQYLYGYQPATLNIPKDSLKQTFNWLGFSGSMRNKLPNSYGITYKPELSVGYFFDNNKANEFDLAAKVPVSKSFGDNVVLNVGVAADITSYKSDSANINNNLFYVDPNVQFFASNVKLTLGVTPAWDKKGSSILPNFTAEAKINGEKFIFQAGWIGYYDKNNYRHLASINPWLQQPREMLNTKTTSLFAGFKGSAGKHFTYNAQLSFQKVTDQPLFVNDTLDGKTFTILNEPDMQVLKIHGEVGYTVQEKFSLLAGATINQFTKVSSYDKAYGLIPLEITGSLRWKLLKDLNFKSDVFFWDGARYRNKALQSQKLDAAFDVNAGLDFAVMPKLSVWLQINNLLNNHYQRWNQYEVLGLNVVGGIVYSFR